MRASYTFALAAVAVALVTVIPSAGLAGPFGLSMGMTKGQVAALGMTLTDDGGHWYSSSAVPKPHSNFESYSLLIDPNTGLAKIIAVGVTLQTNRYGDDVKARFAELSSALAPKYGAADSAYDFLRYGSIWDEPADWMMGLALKERTLASYWTTALPDDLAAVGLTARGLSSTAGYVTLVYEFLNAEEAIDRAAKSESDGL